MNYKKIPNILTSIRIALVIPCVLCLHYDLYAYALAILFLAGVTDGVDGILARRWGCQTKLGAVLDPLADKILVVALFLVFYLKNFIPLWFSLVIISRELILLSGAAFYRFVFGPVIFVPTLLSKLNTCLILLLLLTSLLHGMSLGDYSQFNYYLMMTILFTSIYSAVDYIIKWTIRVYQSFKAR